MVGNIEKVTARRARQLDCRTHRRKETGNCREGTSLHAAKITGTTMLKKRRKVHSLGHGARSNAHL